jgi:hypothetical protein
VAAYDPDRGAFKVLATYWAKNVFREAIRFRLAQPREVSLDAEYNDAKLTEFLADQRDDYREYERCEAMPVEAEKVREALVWLDHRELLAAEVYYGIDREPGLLVVHRMVFRRCYERTVSGRYIRIRSGPQTVFYRSYGGCL